MNHFTDKAGRFRKMDVGRWKEKSKAETLGWAQNKGKIGKLVWLSTYLSNGKPRFEVDTKYQREQSVAAALDIAANFNHAAFGVLVVALINGAYKLMDGGTRYVAVLLLAKDGPSSLPCIVFEGLKAEEQARAFIHLNGHRRAVGQVVRFHAGLTGKDPDYLAVNAITLKAGFAISDDRKLKNALRCPYALLKIYQDCGEEELSSILRFCAACWLRHGHEIISAMIMGVQLFGRQLKKKLSLEIEAPEVIKLFRETELSLLKSQMKTIHLTQAVSVPYSFGVAMVQQWDRGRRTGRLLVVNGE